MEVSSICAGCALAAAPAAPPLISLRVEAVFLPIWDSTSDCISLNLAASSSISFTRRFMSSISASTASADSSGAAAVSPSVFGASDSPTRLAASASSLLTSTASSAIATCLAICMCL
ncbi:hypothetical protein F441_20855 [Phytophthora nicotianae CJ01A1]|uniref:Uncharacterized protein n=1 Tax=Phytophthora nicotianae CJ01A1 TaxID=1317063 RepID=W2VX87_PHYNI|nr:hypothetical protein F441_20855 [Phytophthora nicotianae CJ01A1]